MFPEPGGWDGDEDVDDGFAGEEGHGGAADVVDCCVGDWGGVVGGGRGGRGRGLRRWRRRRSGRLGCRGGGGFPL